MQSKRFLIIFPLLLVLYEMATYLSNDMYLPAMPLLQTDFNVSRHVIQYTLTMWFLGSASLQLILGPLSDRYGRRPVLLIGGVFFIAANIISATTSSFPLFLLARYCQGAAVCSVVVAGYSAIHEYYEHIQAIKVLALMNSFTILAPAFGPLLGVLLIQTINWHAIFWFLAVWVAITILSLFFIMPETNPTGKEKYPINIKSIISNYFNIVSNRKFLLNTVSFCLVFSGLIVWVSAGAFLIIENFHQSLIKYGLIQLFVFSSFIIGTRLVHKLVVKLNVNRVVFIGYIIIAASSILLMLLMWLFPLSLVLLVICLVIYAFGTALLFSTVQRIAVTACKEPMGMIIAMFFTLLGAFCILSSLLAAVIYKDSSLSLAVLIGLLGLLAVFIRFFLLKRV